MKKLQILGTGCPKCKKLAEQTVIAAEAIGGTLMKILAALFLMPSLYVLFNKRLGQLLQLK